MPIALTFREEQCAAYNHRTDLFKSFPGPMDWVPRYTGVAPRDQCKLTCQARALGYYYVLEPRVRTRNLQGHSRLTHFPVVPPDPRFAGIPTVLNVQVHSVLSVHGCPVLEEQRPGFGSVVSDAALGLYLYLPLPCSVLLHHIW